MFRKQTFVVLVLGLAAAGAIRAADETQGGTVEGILTAKGDSWIEVKADGDTDSKRYLAHWRGGMPADGGGPDKEMVAKIKTLIPSNRVKLVWSFNEHPRIESVEMTSTDQASGSVTGAVTAKGETWIEVKPENGPPERYMPHWHGGMPADGGGLDKEMLETLQMITVGDKVTLNWEYSERKRVVKISKAE